MANPAEKALADEVLPLLRAPRDVWRWAAANAHGAQMEGAVEILERAARQGDPGVALAVVQRAVRASTTVLLRADDSSGIIGGVVTDLLRLHAEVAQRAEPPARRLVDWLIAFQFDGRQDFFEIDPVAYRTALGPAGIAMYRARLDEIASGTQPERGSDGAPGTRPEEWEHGIDAEHVRFLLEHNAQRLAVLDRDVDAIVATHAGDRSTAAVLEDTAEAFEEIGRIDLAVDWMRRAAFHRPPSHATSHAADQWCRLMEQHRPEEALDARLIVFHLYPTAASAAALRRASGPRWPEHEATVLEVLRDRPREAVLFVLRDRQDPVRALALMEELESDDRDLRSMVAEALSEADPVRALPLLGRLVQEELTVADAHHYRLAARRLAAMRRLAHGTPHAVEVDELIGDLRETHRRRPRLQAEFDRARLP